MKIVVCDVVDRAKVQASEEPDRKRYPSTTIGNRVEVQGCDMIEFYTDL